MRATAVYPFEFMIRERLHILIKQLFNIDVLSDNNFSNDLGFLMEFDDDGRLVRVDSCRVSYSYKGFPDLHKPTLYYDVFQYPEHTIAGWHMVDQLMMERILQIEFIEVDFCASGHPPLLNFPWSYQVVY